MTNLSDFGPPTASTNQDGAPAAPTNVSDLPQVVPPPPEDHPHMNWARGQLINIENMFLAGQQNTTANMDMHKKNYIADMTSVDDGGRGYYKDDSGKEIPSDYKSQVVMIDPEDGKYKIYGRSPYTERGVEASKGVTPEQGIAAGNAGVGVKWGGGTKPVNVEALSQWFGMGSGAGAPAQTAIPSVAGKVAQAADRLNLNMPQGAISPSTGVKSTALTLSKAPWVGSPLRQQSGRAITALDTRLGQRTEMMSSTGDVMNPAEAGGAARTEFNNWKDAEFGQNGNVGKKFDLVDSLVNPTMKQRLDNTWNVVKPIQDKYTSSGLGSSPVVDKFLGVLRQPGGLTYKDLKFVRTWAGQEIQNPGELSAGIGETELKQIYGGLTEDMNAFMKKNPRAQGAWNDAQQYAKDTNDTLRSLDTAFGNTTGKDEGLFGQIIRYAGTKDSANIAALAKAKGVMDPQKWQDIGASVIDRISKDPKTGEFSIGQFAKGYNGLSDEGKNVLFGAKGTAHRQALDDIALVAENSGNAAKMAAQGGHGLGVSATTAGIIEAGETARDIMHGGLSLGHIGTAATAATAAVGSRGVASLLSHPVTAKAMKRWLGAAQNTGPSGGQAPANMINSAKAISEAAPHIKDAYDKLIDNMSQ